MGQKKGFSYLLIGVGIVIFLVSLFADHLGIGGYPGIGYKQVIGMVVGVVIGMIGFILSRK